MPYQPTASFTLDGGPYDGTAVGLPVRLPSGAPRPDHIELPFRDGQVIYAYDPCARTFLFQKWEKSPPATELH